MFSIDKNVTVPKVRKGPAPKYPFRDMDVGDSFLAPTSHPNGNVSNCNAYVAAKQYSHRYGMKFSGRKAEDGMVRIWRVE